MALADSQAPISREPRILLYAALVGVAFVGAILFVITRLYHPPAPSPYGCYGAPGVPLVRFSADRIIVEGPHHREQGVAVSASNLGYEVAPGLAFARDRSGALMPVDSRDLIALIEQPRPQRKFVMSISLGKDDSAELRQIACPARNASPIPIGATRPTLS